MTAFHAVFRSSSWFATPTSLKFNSGSNERRSNTHIVWELRFAWHRHDVRVTKPICFGYFYPFQFHWLSLIAHKKLAWGILQDGVFESSKDILQRFTAANNILLTNHWNFLKLQLVESFPKCFNGLSFRKTVIIGRKNVLTQYRMSENTCPWFEYTII